MEEMWMKSSQMVQRNKVVMVSVETGLNNAIVYGGGI